TVDGGKVRVPGLGDAHLDLPVSLPGEGSKVTLGLRPQHLSLDSNGATHRVEMAEALGGVSYLYLTGPTGERMIVEYRDDVKLPTGTQVGLTFPIEAAMLFDTRTDQRIR
ncbi:MAG: TOBE domain-containing protein, partial [Paracoccaceae bacterium]|nr:TOBE domain-containing protein [Paracoccaceae bacterium]